MIPCTLETPNTLMTTLLANTPAQAESLLQSLDKAAGGVGLYVNVDKTEYMCFNQNQKETFPTKKWVFETSGQVHRLRKQRLIY